jgi:REP element-mobilizing transposase RayT
MDARAEGAKCCHLIWMTDRGRSWFKIAAAARFCEHAVRHACISRGWTPELVAVFPDRVHLLVRLPARTEARAASRGLQGNVTRLLTTDAQVIPSRGGPLWAGDGWCAVLPSGASVKTVREMLRRRLEVSTPATGAPP